MARRRRVAAADPLRAVNAEFKLRTTGAEPNNIARQQLYSSADTLRIDVGSIAATQVADPEVVIAQANFGVRAADQFVLFRIERDFAFRIAPNGDVGKFVDRDFLTGTGLVSLMLFRGSLRQSTTGTRIPPD